MRRQDLGIFRARVFQVEGIATKAGGRRCLFQEQQGGECLGRWVRGRAGSDEVRKAGVNRPGHGAL